MTGFILSESFFKQHNHYPSSLLHAKNDDSEKELLE